jgi:porin
MNGLSKREIKSREPKNVKSKILLFLATMLLAFTLTLRAADSSAEDTIRPRLSTDEVENQIIMDRKANPLYESLLFKPIKEWRSGVAERTGFNWSLDYSAVVMGVNNSPGDDSAGCGMVRFFGFWVLVNRGGPNKGSLNWKVEHRHKYSDIPVSGLGFDSGYVGLFEAPFSDQGSRLTNLYWKQYFIEGKWVFVGGFLDATDFVDVYLLASPWTGFNNFAFSTGSAAMDLPNDSALGLAAGGMVARNVYIQAGIADANSDPIDPFHGFDTFFSDSDFFKWLEIGFTPGQEQVYFDNLHVTFWHIDERLNGTPDGWGINASWQRWINDKWLPFIRGGYTEDSGSLLERSVTIGVGYQPVPMRGVIGFGFNWGRPNETSFGNLDDQYTTELFWRYQLTSELAVTPSIQYIKDPALNPNENNLWALGLRARLVL